MPIRWIDEALKNLEEKVTDKMAIDLPPLADPLILTS